MSHSRIAKKYSLDNAIVKTILVCILVVIYFSGCSVNNKKQHVTHQPLEIRKSDESLRVTDLGRNWFKVTESVAIANITPERAREIAIQRASNRAISYYSGVEINARTIQIQSESQDERLRDNMMSITSQTSRGIVLEHEILSEKIVSQGNQVYKVVTLKCKIGKQKGDRDPSFAVSADINREYFQNNEEMELTVRSSMNCFLTIFNICSNDSVYVLFPNEYRKNNYLKAGEVFRLPDENDKNIGLTFPVSLLPGKTEDTEAIKILATKKKIDFSSVYSFSAYGTYKSALKDLQKWLIKIPRDEIEEIDLQYYIIDK